MLYELNSWEENMHHDSYGYAVYWDDEKEEVVKHETWATAYAGHPRIETTPLNAHVLEDARRWLARALVHSLKAENARFINDPQDLDNGERVALKTRTRKVFKFRGPSEECRKCDGTGQWINPRRSEDVRDCFGCKGAGSRRGSVEPLKVGGKRVMATLPEGTTGTVVYTGRTPGRVYYANGYKSRPDMDALIILDEPIEREGKVMDSVFISFTKLRRAENATTEDEIVEKAVRLSYGFFFKPFFTRHGGWLDRNHALDFYRVSTHTPARGATPIHGTS